MHESHLLVRLYRPFWLACPLLVLVYTLHRSCENVSGTRSRNKMSSTVALVRISGARFSSQMSFALALVSTVRSVTPPTPLALASPGLLFEAERPSFDFVQALRIESTRTVEDLQLEHRQWAPAAHRVDLRRAARVRQLRHRATAHVAIDLLDRG